MKTKNVLLANLPKNCIADENSNCIECEIEGELICFVDKRFANNFTNFLFSIMSPKLF